MGKRDASKPGTRTASDRQKTSNIEHKNAELSEDTASRYIPEKPTLPRVKEAAAACQACDLWRTGTQTVFGEGRRGARVLFVGEQPGDQEDLSGKPFVGPAGRLLDKALAEAGVDRRDAYVTNVVKHFKWEPRGKRRIHKKPNAAEIGACRPWLDIELALVRPQVVAAWGPPPRRPFSDVRSKCLCVAGSSSKA